MIMDFCVRTPLTSLVHQIVPYRGFSFLRGTHHGQTFRNGEEVRRELLRQSTVPSLSYFRRTATDVSHSRN